MKCPISREGQICEALRIKGASVTFWRTRYKVISHRNGGILTWSRTYLRRTIFSLRRRGLTSSSLSARWSICACMRLVKFIPTILWVSLKWTLWPPAFQFWPKSGPTTPTLWNTASSTRSLSSPTSPAWHEWPVRLSLRLCTPLTCGSSIAQWLITVMLEEKQGDDSANAEDLPDGMEVFQQEQAMMEEL